MKVKYTVKSLIVGGLIIGSFSSVANACSDTMFCNILDDGNIKMNHSLSPVYRSDRYEFSNGATVVINEDKKIYELFIEELGDWSYRLYSKEQVLKYNEVYANNKYKGSKYNNKKVRIKSYSLKRGVKTYSLTNGVKIIGEKGNVKVYLPQLKDLPYNTNSKDVKNMVDTYIECSNFQ